MNDSYYRLMSCEEDCNYEKIYKRLKWAKKKAFTMMRAGIELVVIQEEAYGEKGIRNAWMYTQRDYESGKINEMFHKTQQ